MYRNENLGDVKFPKGRGLALPSCNDRNELSKDFCVLEDEENPSTCSF
jgi:hypothetical protein